MDIIKIIINVGPEWWAIIIAMLLGLAGIFDVRSWIFKPKLKISIGLSPPDCHKIPLIDTGSGNVIDDVYYLRFRIKNDGNREARNVQVLAAGLCKHQNQKYEIENSFLPLNLIWSHIGGYSIQTIPSGAFRHCDLGYLTQGHLKDSILKQFHLQKEANVILKMDTIVEPNTGSHIIFPGKYRLTVYVSASNAKTHKKVFEIDSKGIWCDIEEKMFAESIKIK